MLSYMNNQILKYCGHTFLWSPYKIKKFLFEAILYLISGVYFLKVNYNEDKKNIRDEEVIFI